MVVTWICATHCCCVVTTATLGTDLIAFNCIGACACIQCVQTCSLKQYFTYLNFVLTQTKVVDAVFG